MEEGRMELGFYPDLSFTAGTRFFLHSMSMNLRPRRRPVPTIPIVSLIDIMVILLIFFVATTSFKQRKTSMQIQLPSSQSLGTTATADTSRTVLAISKTNEVFLDATTVKPDALAAALKERLSQNPGTKFELEADTAADLGTLVAVWDALKEAGIAIADVPARLQRK
jgi:biopolymer transport protein ExbD